MRVATKRQPKLLALGMGLLAAVLLVGPAESGVLDASWVAPTTNTDGSPLTDLASYRVYYVAVSAVDLSGNASACSLTASGVAQVDFAVSPTSTVNFGNVNIGSFANQVFTVQNTRCGTVK